MPCHGKSGDCRFVSQMAQAAGNLNDLLVLSTLQLIVLLESEIIVVFLKGVSFAPTDISCLLTVPAPG